MKTKEFEKIEDEVFHIKAANYDIKIVDWGEEDKGEISDVTFTFLDGPFVGKYIEVDIDDLED